MPATSHNTTRRALFAGALAASALAATASLPSIPISEHWRVARRLSREINAGVHGDPPIEALERMWCAEEATLTGPIRSREDAIAKLAAAGLAAERHGARDDGLDAIAHDEAMRWLEAN